MRAFVSTLYRSRHRYAETVLNQTVEAWVAWPAIDGQLRYCEVKLIRNLSHFARCMRKAGLASRHFFDAGTTSW